MAGYDYVDILREHDGQWLTEEEIATIWDGANPKDTRRPSIIYNALRRMGRPYVVMRREKRGEIPKFKALKKWKEGMCKHCQDPVDETRLLCERCR